MEAKVYIYFSKTGVGYEIAGENVISAFDSFILKDGTFIVEFSYSDYIDDMAFFVYEWDNAQKKRRTVFEAYKKENLLLEMMKNIDTLPDNIKAKIHKDYLSIENELEAENAI